jgi:hypothetical protein
MLGYQKPYLEMYYVNQYPSRELEEIEFECQSLVSGSIGVQQSPAHPIS